MQRFLLPSELAAALGVSEAAVTRWGNEGRLQIVKMVGGSQRIALREALRFARDSGTSVKDPTALGFEPLPALKTPDAGDAALEEAVLWGRGAEAWQLTLAMFLAGRKVEAICEGPLTRAMHRVGEAWKQGPAGIQREHRSTVLVAETLHALRTLLPTPLLQTGRALGGALEADPYMLPSLMVSTTLAAMRWQEVNLGPDLPVAALLAAVEEHKPSLVWLSCSVDGLVEQRSAELEQAGAILKERAIELVVGGRGWPAVGAPEGVRHVGTLEAFAKYLRERALKS
jgi:methanogenic corrinoid protein MtbC1